MHTKNFSPKEETQESDKGETISELAHRHMHDEHHTTSDEELKNAKLHWSENSEVKTAELAGGFSDEKTVTTESEATEGVALSGNVDTGASPVPNPYDVLK